MNHKPLICACLALWPVPAMAPERAAEEMKKPKRVVTQPTWKQCSFTVYGNQFEGRPTSSGRRFSHTSRYVACRYGRLGTVIVFRYRSDNGNWHQSRGIIADRGRLGWHRRNRPQYDLPRLIAQELGLYRKGRNARNGEYQYVSIKERP